MCVCVYGALIQSVAQKYKIEKCGNDDGIDRKKWQEKEKHSKKSKAWQDATALFPHLPAFEWWLVLNDSNVDKRISTGNFIIVNNENVRLKIIWITRQMAQKKQQKSE